MNENMNLKETLDLFLSKWKIIVAFLALTTIVGGMSSLAIPPTFEAKVDLLINNPTKNEGSSIIGTYEIDANLRLIETFKYILKSNRMVGIVNREMNGIYTYPELDRKIKIESKSDSQIISIIAHETTRNKAALLVNTYAANFQLEIKELMNLENITILKNATALDTKKVKPNPVIYSLLSFVFGLLCCATAIFVREVYFTQLDTDRKAERALGIPSLGRIPILSEKGKSETSMDSIYADLTSEMELPEIVLEEYRRLIENVDYLMKKKSMKSILITSPSSGDGKTTVCGNLAMIMAMNGKKTVFIDADLRKSDGRTLFNLPDKKGLTTLVGAHYSMGTVLQNTSIENLSFISAGPLPPNPTKFLTSPKMKQLLDELKLKFEFIFINSPPLVVADAVTLSSLVDGCILIIDAQRTKEDIAVKSLAQLAKVDANVVGFVLNKINRSHKKKKYYY